MFVYSYFISGGYMSSISDDIMKNDDDKEVFEFNRNTLMNKF